MAYRGWEEDIDIRRRPSRAPVRERERDEEIDVRIREREGDRTPAFLRQDGRRSEAGPLVLRQRDVETFDRHAPREPTDTRMREVVRRPKSVGPPRSEFEHEHDHVRVIERDRYTSPVRRRSPSPRPVRYVERRRRSSSSEHDHIRIIERERERIPSPSPSPSPPPPPAVVKGPTIEREVITHYRDIDHGMIQVRRPSPAPPPRPRQRETETRETDIDISLSRHRTDVDVDIHRSSSRRRPSRSRERRSTHHDDELDIIVRRDGERLRVDDAHRRSRSAAPTRTPMDEEGEYITSKIDSRGRMGEAWGGHTKDWAIVDVPPGTERVRMEGVGGGATDTKWSRYSGVRRTQFIPERDGAPAPTPRAPPEAPARDRGGSTFEREIDIDIDINRHRDRRVSQPPAPPPAPPPREMWTEITKDLVIREAIQQMGYSCEETHEFFYVMEYLRYDDVMRLTELSEEIRRSRGRRAREIEYERDWREDWHRHQQPQHHHHSRPRRSDGRWEEDRVTEIVYDSYNGPERRYR